MNLAQRYSQGVRLRIGLFPFIIIKYAGASQGGDKRYAHLQLLLQAPGDRKHKRYRTCHYDAWVNLITFLTGFCPERASLPFNRYNGELLISRTDTGLILVDCHLAQDDRGPKIRYSFEVMQDNVWVPPYLEKFGQRNE